MQPIKKKCDHFEIFREKLSDLYMSDFCLYGLMIQKLQGIIAFWGKKLRTK